MAAGFFRFKQKQLAAEDLYNRATLREFNGELIGDEIELALGFYQESITELDVALQKIDQLLDMVRTNASLPEFDAALAKRFVDVNVNGLPRIGQVDHRQIVTIEDFLLVKKSELATLRQFTEDAIQFTRDITEEINSGLFVATLLGSPNQLKAAKTALGFGRITVSNLFFAGAKATGIAVGDNFPLGFEFLLQQKKCSNDGDVNGNQVLDFGDVLCAFNILQNDQSLPPECNVEGFDCELIAADVNCDSTVTFEDVLAIFFRFLTASPPEQCFAQSTLSRVSPYGGRYQLSLNQPSSLALSKAVEGNFMEFSLTVDNPGRSPNAFGLKLEYPADQLEFIRVERTSLTTDWIQLASRLDQPGVILVGGFNNEPLSPVSSGELFRVVFAHKGEPTSLSEFKISNLMDGFRSVEVANIDPNDIVSEPKTFNLHQNFPNPFNPETRIRFEVPKLSGDKVRVQLSIYNIAGQLVRVLLDEERSSGPYEVQWDGRNGFGVPVPSGVYFYTLTAGDFKATKKMLEVK